MFIFCCCEELDGKEALGVFWKFVKFELEDFGGDNSKWVLGKFGCVLVDFFLIIGGLDYKFLVVGMAESVVLLGSCDDWGLVNLGRGRWRGFFCCFFCFDFFWLKLFR